jgi:hypothetical protein
MKKKFFDLRLSACICGSFILAVHVFSATRSLAERARGLAASSDSAGVMGFFVRFFSSPVCSADRNACLTARSSIDWKLITASRPPVFRNLGACSSRAARFSISRLTFMRRARKVRVAGSIFSGAPRRCGIAKRTSSANRSVDVIGEMRRACASFLAICREERSWAYSYRTLANSSSAVLFTIWAADSVRRGSIRMSSGISFAKDSPYRESKS